MTIGQEQTLAGHVMKEATRAADWLREAGSVEVDVVMLIPYGDPIGERYERRYQVMEGPEDNVLTRFDLARSRYLPDYVVRLTGDCAWMERRVIVQMVRAAIKYGADYTSNVLTRTFMEGLDVEVMTERLMKHLARVIDDSSEREHVTSAIPRLLKGDQLRGFSVHTVMSDYDYSGIKTSIDTHDEYVRCNELYKEKRRKKDEALSWGTVST
jgi:spore coat polysaccharide biosynthesis protein SpsF (cytidylyltransferase family)